MTAARAAAETIEFRVLTAAPAADGIFRDHRIDPQMNRVTVNLAKSSISGSTAIVLTGLSTWGRSQLIASVARNATLFGYFVLHARSSSVDVETVIRLD